MKILYALPARGNGHISRAITLHPYLSKIGSVEYLISGCNASLHFPYRIAYRLKGISLFYNKNGGLDHLKFVKNLNPISIYNSIWQIPVQKYDWVITDFEPLTELACKLKRVPCMHWGHQESFTYDESPRPEKRNLIGEYLLTKYVRGNIHYGLHFQAYHPNITGPVIKNSILESNCVSEDLVTVYLPQYDINEVLKILQKIKHLSIQIFHPNIDHAQHYENISVFPINKEFFDNSLRFCKLLITGAGFETPSEALYLNKRIISLPIKSHYEQLCNAAALSKMGVCVFDDLKHLLPEIIIREFELHNTSPANFNTSTPQEICFMALSKWEDYLDKKNLDLEIYDFIFKKKDAFLEY